MTEKCPHTWQQSPQWRDVKFQKANALIKCPKLPIIRSMRRIAISVFAFYISAALFATANATAQSFPTPTGEVFRQEGIASWYGPQFEGRPTASGEIFSSSLFTAAHPTLPFGTLLIVTNTNNNRQVSVRVNDRGPFVEGRIIDLSQAAAEHLDMLVTGTAPVIIETITAQGFGFAQPQVSASPQTQQPQAFAPPQAQQPQAVALPPQTLAQPTQGLAQPQAPILVGTTTIPMETSPSAPITINIFHVPHDFSQPPTAIVVTEPQPAAPVSAWVAPNGIIVGAVPQAPLPEPKVSAETVLQPPPQPQAAPVLPGRQQDLPEDVLAILWGQPAPSAVPAPAAQVLVPAQPQPASHDWQAQQTAPSALPPPALAPAQESMPQPVIHAPQAQQPMEVAAHFPQIATPGNPVVVPIINANPNGTYRVQVGSFQVARNAVDTFVRLRGAGFDPKYERNGEFFRVVIAGIRGTEIQAKVERLAAMGYHNVMVTAEF